MSASPPNALPPIALTMGDPGGVGAEITVKAWAALRHSGPAFFLIDDPARIAKLSHELIVIREPGQARDAFATGLPVLALTSDVSATPGLSQQENARPTVESIERAVGFALDGSAAAIVTNPIQKSTLMAAGFAFPGHTEFLGDLTTSAPMPKGRERGPVMMLSGPQLRTVPVTIHYAVKDAVAMLTPQLIVHTAMITAEALRDDFAIANPRIVISGLNPHAGEAGALGVEDDMIIAPAVDELRDIGLNVRGPLPADTMFHEEARATYDAALCMLHDQALIPAKTLAFHDAVNVTLGLPIIRTSPDHGTALDIAGKGVARADSLIAAIHLAAEMAQTRRQHL
jgi:4-hydroxythreonine-4-phosphate dehydrogenase